MLSSHSCFLKAFLLVLFLLTSSKHVISQNPLELLLKLRDQLESSNNTTLLESWKQDASLCQFYGITCSPAGSVIEINLDSQTLSGPLPLDLICQLQTLQKLSLASNSLSGYLKADLSNCTNLIYLNLAYNELEGTVPDLSSLTRLQVLDLSRNAFTGPFPWSSLTSLTDLTELKLGDNPFPKTQLPDEISLLRKLKVAYISNCSLEGEIPSSIGNLTELVRLEISTNNLYGEIPKAIAKLSKLRMLELYDNGLTGKFPDGFGNISRLQYLDASGNSLEGDVHELRSLSNLVSLQLFNNNFSGELPPEFGSFRHLVNVSLYSNSFNGPLPQSIGSRSEFNYIDVSDNYFTGPIPPDMCKRGTMQRLLMLDNRLTGEIPSSYGNCHTLIRFRVSNNKLSGTVPAALWGLPNAVILDLERNDLEGPIPADIKNAKTLSLLFIRFNRFSGALPEGISESESLITLDASWNQLSGKIPSKIGKLRNLNTLLLHNNWLSGHIPDELGSCESITELNLAGNDLSGHIPTTLSSLSNLNLLNLSGNHLTGRIPHSISSLKLSLLDLSNNYLSGPIPDALLIGAYARSFDGNQELCSTINSSYPRCSDGSAKSKQTRNILVSLLAIFVLLVASFSYFVFFKMRNEEEFTGPVKSESWDLKPFQVLTFTEQDVLSAVKQENMIGRGGSGNVYKLVLGDGKELAVKHVWRVRHVPDQSSSAMLKKDGRNPEFDAEVASLSSIRHLNVVKLYCSVASEDSFFLVYEYLPNGSLWDRLHGCIDEPLEWLTRYDIALGAAKGLEYLHHGCAQPVIHRDVKSSNILLDSFFKPRIADFGLAKIAQAGKYSTHIIAGTLGYIAPEYAYNFKVNEKSDVYSFGVVLLELVTGKRPIELEYGEGKDIVDWVMHHIASKETAKSLLDSRISQVFKEDALKVLRLAVLCTAKLPTLRPSMKMVVHMLEEAEPNMLNSDDLKNKSTVGSMQHSVDKVKANQVA